MQNAILDWLVMGSGLGLFGGWVDVLAVLGISMHNNNGPVVKTDPARTIGEDIANPVTGGVIDPEINPDVGIVFIRN